MPLPTPSLTRSSRFAALAVCGKSIPQPPIGLAPAGPGGQRLFGWGEIAGWFTALIGSFGDARVHIQHVAAVDDMVAVRWELTGTHDGGALYGAATGEPVYILAVTHWRIAHSMIVDEVSVFDEIALMRQMEGGL